MPTILTTTTGIWPKVAPTNSACPNLRTSLHRFDRGELTADALDAVVQQNIARAVTEQLAAGIDLPTDGLIRWTDLFAPFVAAWNGLTRRGIHRFYDTNTLYGEPVVTGAIEYAPSFVAADYAFARTIHPSIKATLPGVFTFAAACVDEHYHDAAKLRAALAENLFREAEALVAAGAEYLELHEPELGWGKYDAAEVETIYKKFATLKTQILITTYFRNFPLPITKALQAAGCGIGLQPSIAHECGWHQPGDVVQLGIVNSRETRLEGDEVFAKFREKVKSGGVSSAKTVLFSTSSNVEYLPHAKALKKVALLAKVK